MTRYYYSADSHVVEPPEVFEGLERFGERAPRIVKDPPGREGIYVVFPTREREIPLPVGRFGIAGARLDDPETQERIKHGWDRINPGVRDPVARLTEQDQDQIVGEVMYPSINMFTFSLPDREVCHAVFQRHNDWIVDYTSHAPARLIAAACIPLPDVEASLAELDRMLKKGVQALAIPCTAPPDKPYSDPIYEPFWSAVEEAGLPLSMHIFCGAEWGMSLPSYWNGVSSYALALSAIAWTVETLPASVTWYVPLGWMAHWLQRLDHAVYRVPNEVSPQLTMKPSEYFQRNFYATFEDDELGVRTRDVIGVDRLLWGNDYPHHDSIWSNSVAVIDEIMQGVPEDEVRKMTWDNVIKLYNLDEAKLRAVADEREAAAATA